MKSKNDLDKLEAGVLEALKMWQAEIESATVPTPPEDITELIMNKVKGLLLKLARIENK